MTEKPVVRAASYFLAHVPGLVRYGSKPSREIAKDHGLLARLSDHLRPFSQAVCYPPNQVFIGNLYPDELRKIPRPWYLSPFSDATRRGAFGEIMPEREFLGMLKVSDDFDLVLLEQSFADEVRESLREHLLINESDLKKLETGAARTRLEEEINRHGALPLFHEGKLVGCVRAGHENDASLTPSILLENLSARASGAMALRWLLHQPNGVEPGEVDYLLGCGEEAVGDRYNRGGGNLAKAIGELCSCAAATGADVKAFCCAPIHAVILGASLVAAGVYRRVVVVGGGSLAKLGMKFLGHLAHDMPVLEDVLAATAILIGPDDGRSPGLRLDVVGRHRIGAGSSQQAIIEKLVREPLSRAGLRISDIEKYATELHDPDVTEPSGSGDVPRTNYRLIAALAAFNGEIGAKDLDSFVEKHGMPGFAPTQGHVASAVPFLGHAINAMRRGEIGRTLFLAKGSLFLGRITQLSDGISILLERNP